MEIFVSMFAVAVALSCLVVLVISGMKDRREQAAQVLNARNER